MFIVLRFEDARSRGSNMNATLLGPIISAVAAFLGVLVGTALLPWLRSRSARKQAARFLAIRVVCVLEKYLEACASVATDSGEENKDGMRESRVSEPRAPVYPSDLDWHSIEYTLMYRLMMLQTLAERGARSEHGSRGGRSVRSARL